MALLRPSLSPVKRDSGFGLICGEHADSPSLKSNSLQTTNQRQLRASWESRVSPDVLNALHLSRDGLYTQEALHELHETGASFARDVFQLLEIFVVPLEKYQQQAQNSSQQQSSPIIALAQITPLVQFCIQWRRLARVVSRIHNLLAHALVVDPVYPDYIIDILPDLFLDSLRLYAHSYFVIYCAYIPCHMHALRTLRLQAPEFDRFCTTTFRHSSFRSLDLADFIITPMQRLTKIPLLLRAIIQKVSSDAPYGPLIQNIATNVASNCVHYADNFAGVIQLRLAAHDHMLALDNKFHKDLGFSLISYTHKPRYLLLTDHSVSFSGNKRCTLFLFTDLLLLVVRPHSLSADLLLTTASSTTTTTTSLAIQDIKQNFIIRKLWLWTTEYLLTPPDSFTPISSSTAHLIDHSMNTTLAIEFSNEHTCNAFTQTLNTAITKLHAQRSTSAATINIKNIATLSISQGDAVLEPHWTCAARIESSSLYLLGSDIGLWMKDTTDRDVFEPTYLSTVTTNAIHQLEVTDNLDQGSCITIESDKRSVVIYSLSALIDLFKTQRRYQYLSKTSSYIVSTSSSALHASIPTITFKPQHSTSMSTFFPRAVAAISRAINPSTDSSSLSPTTYSSQSSTTTATTSSLRISSTKLRASKHCTLIHITYMFCPPTLVLLAVAKSFILYNIHPHIEKSTLYSKRAEFYCPLTKLLPTRSVLCRTHQILLAMGDRFVILDTRTTAIFELPSLTDPTADLALSQSLFSTTVSHYLTSTPATSFLSSLSSYELEAISIHPLHNGTYLLCYRAFAIIVTAKGQLLPNANIVRYTHPAIATSFVLVSSEVQNIQCSTDPTILSTPITFSDTSSTLSVTTTDGPTLLSTKTVPIRPHIDSDTSSLPTYATSSSVSVDSIIDAYANMCYSTSSTSLVSPLPSVPAVITTPLPIPPWSIPSLSPRDEIDTINDAKDFTHSNYVSSPSTSFHHHKERPSHFLLVYSLNTIECWDPITATLIDLRPMPLPYTLLSHKNRLAICGRGEWLVNITIPANV